MPDQKKGNKHLLKKRHQTRPGASNTRAKINTNTHVPPILKNGQKEKKSHIFANRKKPENKMFTTEVKKANAIILDTNTLIYNPQCIRILIKDGNTVIIPSQVMIELDNLKNRSDVGYDAREAARVIEDYRSKNNMAVQIHLGLNFSGLLGNLNKRTPDHIIMAQAHDYHTRNKERFNQVKLLSQDSIFRTLAREVLPDICVEDYHNDKTEEKKLKILIKSLNVESSEIQIKDGKFCFPVVSQSKSTKVSSEERKNIPLNSGVIGYSNWRNKFKSDWGSQFVAIRHNDVFTIIPESISAFNIGPYNITNGNNSEGNSQIYRNKDNWGQAIALAQLLDPEINCVFLQGKAGTGKTLIALAAAIEQKNLYRKIIVARPAVPLEDKDTMGFLPGDIKSKLDPWLEPIWMNLDFLANREPVREKRVQKNKSHSTEEASDFGEGSIVGRLISQNKIMIKSLDYIRGQTFEKTFLIIDEAQNLTPHQIKTIITRVGKGSKIIFTGDLGQIDRYKKLDRYSSGLSYAMTRLINNAPVAVTNLPDGVRSELANLAEELL